MLIKDEGMGMMTNKREFQMGVTLCSEMVPDFSMRLIGSNHQMDQGGCGRSNIIVTFTGILTTACDN